MVCKTLLALCAAFVLYLLFTQPGPTLLILACTAGPYLLALGLVMLIRALSVLLEGGWYALRCQFDREFREIFWHVFTQIERRRPTTMTRRLERRLAELSTRVGHQAPEYWEAPRNLGVNPAVRSRSVRDRHRAQPHRFCRYPSGKTGSQK